MVPPNSSLMSIAGVLRVLVLSTDMLPRTLAMTIAGVPRASRWALVLSSSGDFNGISDGHWEGPFFAFAENLSATSPVSLPSPNQ